MSLYVKTTRLGGAMRHNFWTAKGNTKPYRWPLPDGDRPGDWLNDSNPAPLQPHRAGINLAPFHSVLQYVSTENYLAEAAGETAEAHDCVVAKRVRLLRLLPITAQQWRETGIEYAQTACGIIEQIDHVRPYLEGNAALIAGPFQAIVKAHRLGWTQAATAPIAKDTIARFDMQVARFAHDIPSSGLYTGPATAALHATKALAGTLGLIASRDDQLDHADQVKTIAYHVREAAGAVAEDYVEHRGRVGSPQDFAALCSVEGIGNEAPDDFARQIKRSLFKWQNDHLRQLWKL